MLYDCVNPKAVELLRCVIAFSLLMLLVSFAAFILDLAAPSQKHLKPLRSFAIFNITAGQWWQLSNNLI